MKQLPHIVHVISSLKIGGAEMVLYDLVKGLHEKKYPQTVLYFHEGPLSTRLKNLGITVYQVTGLVGLYDPVFWWRMYQFLKRLQPTLTHASLWSAGVVTRIIAKWMDIPVVSAFHAQLEHHGPVRNFLDRITLSQSDICIAVTTEVKASITRYIPAVRDTSIVCITNGIDIAQFEDRQKQYPVSRARYGLSDEHLVLGSVGRFVPVKQYDLLIDIFAQVAKNNQQARLILIGMGPLETQLRMRAVHRGVADSVVFIIGVDAAPLYQLMDIFIQPSESEGLSLALLEAMASRLPCVATGIAGRHPVISDGVNGLLVDPKRPQTILAAVGRLISSPRKRAQLAQAAWHTVSQYYSSSAMLLGYEKVFLDTLSDSNSNN